MEARSRVEREAELSAMRGLRALRGVLMCGGVLLLASIAVAVMVWASKRPSMTVAELAEAVGPIAAGESGGEVRARVWPIVVGPWADALVWTAGLTLLVVVVGSCLVVVRAWAWRGIRRGEISWLVMPGLVGGGAVAFVTFVGATMPTTKTTDVRVWEAAAALRGKESMYLRDEPRKVPVGLTENGSGGAGVVLLGGGAVAVTIAGLMTVWSASVAWGRQRRGRREGAGV